MSGPGVRIFVTKKTLNKLSISDLIFLGEDCDRRWYSFIETLDNYDLIYLDIKSLKSKDILYYMHKVDLNHIPSDEDVEEFYYRYHYQTRLAEICNRYTILFEEESYEDKPQRPNLTELINLWWRIKEMIKNKYKIND